MLSEILETIKKNFFLIFLIVLIAFLSFQLGRISKTASQPIRIEKTDINEISNNGKQTITNQEIDKNRGEGRLDFRVLASKKSTSGKYHFLWCSGAKQIKEENKIFFNSEKEAISAGYTLAGNCSK